MQESESLASSSPSKTWPETRRGRIIILAGMIGLFVLVFWMAMKSRQMIAVPVGLVVSANDLDVGEVWEQGEFQRNLTIRNTTEKEVTIDGFSSSCGCLSIEPSSLTIPSGKEAEVRATLNLTLGDSRDNMNFEVKITPVLRDLYGQHPPVWIIRGQARRLMKLRPRTISFYANQLVRGQAFPSHTAIATPNIELGSLKAKYPAELATVEVARCTEDNNSFQVNITPRKSLPVGPFRFDVLLEPVRKDKLLPIVKLPIEGRVMGDVQAIPDSVILGARRVGETATETLTLRSEGGVPLVVRRFCADSTDTQIEPFTVKGVSDHVFRINQHITKLGKQVFSIRFSVTKNGESSTLKVKGTYEGTPVVNRAALDHEG